MLPTRGISKKSMAINRLNHSLNDSLDSSSNGEHLYPSCGAPVGPEEFNQETDFRAFSKTGEEPDSSVYLNLLPLSEFLLLQDKTSGKNRALGVEKLQAAIEGAKSTTVLESNLASLVEDACAAVSDSHIKVSLAGLELLEPLIRRTGNSLTPHLPSLVESILGKMSTNKYVLKKAGMKLLGHLMHYCGPHDVSAEVAKFGLTHKHSKVREESLNVITVALIRFQKSEFRLIQLAKEIMPTLCDAKPRVRQACMECLAKIASLCNHRDFKQIVSFAVKNGHRSDEKNDLAILQALNCRIVRECPPRLKEDGLVEHAMPVVGREIPLSEHGADVDWIRDGAVPQGGSVPNGLEASSVRREGRLRPFRSAKGLPWEVDDAERSRKDGDISSKLNATADASATFTLPKDSPPLPHHRPPSSRLFTKEGSSSPPSRRPPTGRKKMGLAEMVAETQRIANSPNGSGTALLRDLRDMVPPASVGGTLPPPIPPPGSKFSRRHQSLPNGVVNRDLQTRGCVRKVTNFGNGSPKLSPIGSAAKSRKVDTLEKQTRPQPPIPPLPSGEEFSETWPRSRASVRCKTASRKLPEEETTAEPLKAPFGGDLRPPSKPRVRNPIILKQRQEKKLKLLQQQLKDGPQDSPTATEQEFLMSNNTTLPGVEDEYYYSMVPEDTTTLDNSLSCSLTSLCRPARETNVSTAAEVDTLRSIRKEVASRRARLQSTDGSNQPQNSPRHDETPVGPGLRQLHQETASSYRRETSGVGIEKDFNKTFTAGESLAHIHPSSTTWQALQSLTQTAPSEPIVDKPRKKTKKKKRRSGSDEGEGSSGGSNLTLEGGRAGDASTMEVRCSTRAERGELPLSQEHREKQRLDGATRLPVLKARLRRGGSLGPEGQRPSIERGGTNTITMEVNGVKSPPPQLSPEQLSPVEVLRGVRETRTRKKRVSEPASVFSEARAVVGPSKPPLPHHLPPAPSAFTANESPEGSCGGLLPEVPRPHPRKKHSKYAVTKTRDDFPQQHGSLHPSSSVDEGGVVENLSPGGSKLCLPELQPFSNAERGLRVSLDQIDNSEWNEKCEGLLGVRRLAMFHLDWLIPELHTVILAVVEEVKNLRSSVARAAIACLADIFTYAGRYMDPDLDRVVKVLLHKTGESSVFIRENVEKTMCEIVQHATTGKLLLAIINSGQSHRNIQVRRAAAQFLGQTVECCGSAQLLHGSRDLAEKTLVATLNFISDAAAEPRYYGRKCLSHIATAADLEKIASRILNAKQYSRLKEALETLRNKGVGEPPTDSTSTRSRHPTGGTLRTTSHVRGTVVGRTAVEEVDSKPRNARRASQNAQGGENPPLPHRLVERLKCDSWEDRKEAICVLEKFVNRYPKALEPHMNKVFDAFNPRLTDRNSKVNLQALQAFSNMVPLLGNLLAPIIANIIKALMPNLASKNVTIHNAAMTVLDLISQCVDPMSLIQPIATHSQHGNARVQPIMIRKLAELTREIYSQNAKQVVRQVLPVMWHLLAGKPPGSNDGKDAVVKLCESLFNTMGQSFLDSAANLPPQSQRRLDQILQSRNFN